MDKEWHSLDELVGKVDRMYDKCAESKNDSDTYSPPGGELRYQFDGRAHKKQSSFATFLRYAFVASFLFTVFFVGSNWPAYRMVISYYWNSLSGGTVQTNVFSTDVAPDSIPLDVDNELTRNSHKKIDVQIPLSITAPDNRLIIPSLNLSVPIGDVDPSLLHDGDDLILNNAIQNALRNGVVRYPGTADPGKRGNTFITGHSSYYLWDPGAYKDVFALLPHIQVDDEIIIHYKQKVYRYQVSSTKEVWPDQVDVLNQTEDYRLSLMTCVPIGTNLKRLIVVAKLVK